MEILIMELTNLLEDLDRIYKVVRRMIRALQSDSLSETKDEFDMLQSIVNKTDWNFARQILDYIETCLIIFWNDGEK